MSAKTMCICVDRDAAACKAKRYGYNAEEYHGEPCQCTCHNQQVNNFDKWWSEFYPQVDMFQLTPKQIAEVAYLIAVEHVAKEAEIERLRQVEAAAKRSAKNIIRHCESAGLKNIATNDPVQMAVYMALHEAKNLAALVQP